MSDNFEYRKRMQLQREVRALKDTLQWIRGRNRRNKDSYDAETDIRINDTLRKIKEDF